MDGSSDAFRQTNGNRVTELPHRLRPGPEKDKVIGEGLQTGRFPHREISNRAIGAGQHVFAARNAMVARLERFRWFVKGASGVACITPRAGIEFVIGKLGGSLLLGSGKSCMASRTVCQGRKKLIGAAQLLHAGEQAIGDRRPPPPRNAMPVPILARRPLPNQKRGLGMGSLREDPLAPLRHPVIRGVQQTIDHVVFGGDAAGSVVFLQPGAMPLPALRGSAAPRVKLGWVS